jgi:polyisoprenoid-binding protein YceI
MKRQKFEIVTALSEIAWTAKKVTGAHNGTIGIKEGSLTLKDNQLVAGKIIIDTTTIRILDIADPAMNAQFAGHLASDDFFSSAKYPTAVLEFISVEMKSEIQYEITGNLTIKGITHPAFLDAELIIFGYNLHASAKMMVDRTHYNMRFRSGNFFQNLGDTLIYDAFDLNMIIAAVAVKTGVVAY